MVGSSLRHHHHTTLTFLGSTSHRRQTSSRIRVVIAPIPPYRCAISTPAATPATAPIARKTSPSAWTHFSWWRRHRGAFLQPVA